MCLQRLMNILCGFLLFAAMPTKLYADESQNMPFEIIATPYPPFVHAEGPQAGYSSALLMKVLDGFEHPYSFYIVPSIRAQLRAAEGKHLISFLPPVKNDEQFIRYEQKVKSIHYKLFQQRPIQHDWNDLTNKVIGSLNLSLGSDFLDEFKAEGAVISNIPNFESGIRMLTTGRLDFIVGIDLSIMNIAKKLEVENQIVASEDVLTSFSMLSFYVNLQHPLAKDLATYLEQQNIVELLPAKL